MKNNPILPGFHPDPCLLFDSKRYWLACSTFEWFPGVALYYSDDMLQWHTAPSPLNRRSQLDLRGNGPSCGVWAPDLSYDGTRYYLCYTNTRYWKGAMKDTPNFLVTADDPLGPWSDPVFLNCSGFDPSLFHAPDGRKWLLNMIWDHRTGNHPFAGIALQEFDYSKNELTGPVTNIFRGSEIAITEGPRMFFKDGFYYLITAEGGTSYGHAVTVARSINLTGPYEISPHHPLLSSAKKPDAALQKAGHATLVQTPWKKWVMSYLCARPNQDKHCPLGRETALQEVLWDEQGWPHTANKDGDPAENFIWNGKSALPLIPTGRDIFNQKKLPEHFLFQRRPAEPNWLNFTENAMCLTGQESLCSCHEQSLVARRIQHFAHRSELSFLFRPESFQQMAGLVNFYDTENWVYLHISYDEHFYACLSSCDRGEYKEWEKIKLQPELNFCWNLKSVWHNGGIRFAVQNPGTDQWTDFQTEFSQNLLSDEHPTFIGGFTGAFTGMAVQDLSGRNKQADFLWFEYLPAD